MTHTLPTALDEPWHGTRNGYYHHKCRCDDCKKAVRLANKKNKQKNKDKIRGDELWHGTSNGYESHLCRCDKCCFANKINVTSRRYGISQNEVRRFLSINKCEICNTETPTAQGWIIDHDHSCCHKRRACGKCIRGLLCQKCNSVIGFAKDDPEILKSAIAYLERYSA